MTEKEKQLYEAAKNTFNSWPKWKQEAALDFMNAYKEEPETTSLKLCPKCGKIVGFNSYFQSYYCESCGNMFGKKNTFFKELIMGKLAKEFADIINEQDFCFEPYEMKIVKLAIKAVNEWEEQNKGCYGCLHLGDKKYKCELCARFGHADHYVSNT